MNSLKYKYKVTLMYNENYFESEDTPLKQIVTFASIRKNTKKEIQFYYMDAKVIKVQLIK